MDSPATRTGWLACNYVRAFTDVWAHASASTDICNPLANVECSVSAAGDIRFALKVDDKNGVFQTAVLMLALDSFVSLAASSSCTVLQSNKQNSAFVLRIPCDVSGETLLNNKGFPAGSCGPFKRWSLPFRYAKLSGKNGAVVAAALADILNDEHVSGTGVMERMNVITAAAQQLDDSEMGRILNRSRFSVSARHGKKRRRNADRCSSNPLSFLEKFVLGKNPRRGSRPPLPPPSAEFTSLFLTGAEADACYRTLRVTRGASGLKSLLSKYRAMQENETKTKWEWSSPQDRKLVLMSADGREHTLTFRIVCEKSDRFDTVTSLTSNVKHWVRDTAKLLDNLRRLDLPQTERKVSLLLETLAEVISLRDSVGFRIPDHGKKWLPDGQEMPPMSGMGITSCRYDRAIEVLNLLMAGGALLTSALNHSYFFERGVTPGDLWWPHVDVVRLTAVKPSSGSTGEFVNISASLRQNSLSENDGTLSGLILRQGAYKALAEYTVPSSHEDEKRQTAVGTALILSPPALQNALA